MTTTPGPTVGSHTTGVLIVGAGPTGLTLACNLARRGISFRIIDTARTHQKGSRGKGVQPRSLEVFEDLGVAKRLLDEGRSAMPMRSTSAHGEVTEGGQEPAELAGRPDIPYTTSLITPEWRVEEALRDRLADFEGSVEFNTTLREFESTDTGVRALVSTGAREEVLMARWLVGCDGGHSSVRKGAEIKFPGETREDIRMFVADGEVHGLGREAWHLWRSDEGFVTICPLPSTDLFQFGFVLNSGEEAPQTLHEMQATLDRRIGPSGIRLNTPQWSSVWRSNSRLAETYRKGRVLLAGDAAHVHSPTGGQGMNTGIQDAHNLGWKLAAVERGMPDCLLETYDAERRPVAAGVLEASGARLEAVLRDKGVSTRRDASTLQLDVSYRDSALSQDYRGLAVRLRAGDRAPDATHLVTMDGQRRLFDLLAGEDFVVIVFNSLTPMESIGDETRTIRVVGEITAPDDVIDREGSLAAIYEATDETIIVIRPDGHIGMINDEGSVDQVIRYLQDAYGDSVIHEA